MLVDVISQPGSEITYHTSKMGDEILLRRSAKITQKESLSKTHPIAIKNKLRDDQSNKESELHNIEEKAEKKESC